jgi:glutamine amidotransferase-like uncharacterized protein
MQRNRLLTAPGRALLCLLVAGSLALFSCTTLHARTTMETFDTTQQNVRAAPVTPGAQPTGNGHPLALVYRGPGGCKGCSEAVAALLRHSRWQFEVKYIGPKEKLKLNAQNLRPAVLYAQPGGKGSAQHAYRKVTRQLGSPAIMTNWVKSGGHYLGLCMGGYLAGNTKQWPGFGLLPGKVGEWINSPGASWTSTKDTVLPLQWRGQHRWMYFQDGPYFKLNSGASGVNVLAKYENGDIAALTAPFGKGRIGVVGPHPEATASWYQDNHLTDPDGHDADLGQDLINTLMQP